MTVGVARRLPGFAFQVQPPPLDESLPRLDIAAFVGFTASGPLHTPVVVEDPGHFADVFGQDATLAWDAMRQAPLMAQLPPAVRAFFRNGGQRAVDRPRGRGRRGHEPLPHPRPRPDRWGRGRHAGLRPARSAGSWSDPLGVTAALASQSFAITGMTLGAVASQPVSKAGSSPGGATIDLEINSPGAVVNGDLLRLDFNGGDDVLFATVAGGTALGSPFGSPLGGSSGSGPTRFVIRRWAWFRPTWKIGNATTTGVTNAVPVSLPGGTWYTSPPADPDSPLTLILQQPFSTAPPPGSLLRVDFGSESLWFRVQAVVGTLPAGSPAVPSVELTGQGLWAATAAPHPKPVQPAAADRLSFELGAGKGGGDPVKLAGLTFCADHPSFWGALPVERGALRRYGPVAGRPEGLGFVVPGTLAARRRAAIPPGRRRARRRLVRADRHGGRPRRRARSRAESCRFTDPRRPRQVRRQPLPRPEAEHAAGGPDRFQDGRSPGRGGVPPVRPPVPAVADRHLRALRRRRGDDRRRARRRSQDLEKSRAVRSDSPAHRRTQSGSSPPGGRFVECGPQSIPEPTLTQAGSDPTVSYKLTWTVPAATTTGLRFRLREATEPDFGDEADIAFLAEDSITIYGRPPGVYYYHVRAETAGATGPWSKGIDVQVEPQQVWQVDHDTPYSPDALLAVQRALLRMCGARGDLFAVLSMPAHFREDDAIAHAAALQSSAPNPVPVGNALVAPIDLIEGRALSYGALYHPWAIGPDDGAAGTLRWMPPDGFAAGIMSLRSSTRGPWVAPANQQWTGPVNLTPAIARRGASTSRPRRSTSSARSRTGSSRSRPTRSAPTTTCAPSTSAG